jgi:hypothetical protein
VSVVNDKGGSVLIFSCLFFSDGWKEKVWSLCGAGLETRYGGWGGYVEWERRQIFLERRKEDEKQRAGRLEFSEWLWL